MPGERSAAPDRDSRCGFHARHYVPSPPELGEPEERPGREAAEKGARASGTLFISFFAPAAMLALARAVGFREAVHVSAATLTQRYFAGRTDGLRPGSEELLLATTG